MTLNRLAFAIIVIVYLALATAAGQSHASEIFHSVYPVFIAYIIGALVLFAHILYRPAAVPARRIVAAVYDMAMISYAAEACGTASGFFYPLYLWTIFGNGFRFGVAYLFISMGIAIAGFTIVIVLTGFWATNPGFSAALLIGLVMLPIYVSRLIRKLSEAKRQAEDASRAKSQFLASVSHELRTPLNAIIGLSSLFETAKLDREHAEMVETIGAAGRTLLGHINSILDLSRIEAGKMLSQNAEFDLYELLVYVRNIVAVQRQELRISIHITPRTPSPRCGRAATTGRNSAEPGWQCGEVHPIGIRCHRGRRGIDRRRAIANEIRNIRYRHRNFAGGSGADFRKFCAGGRHHH